jgi:hypothetical protein
MLSDRSWIRCIKGIPDQFATIIESSHFILPLQIGFEAASNPYNCAVIIAASKISEMLKGNNTWKPGFSI